MRISSVFMKILSRPGWPESDGAKPFTHRVRQLIYQATLMQLFGHLLMGDEAKAALERGAKDVP
jgi:hypothetical protein